FSATATKRQCGPIADAIDAYASIALTQCSLPHLLVQKSKDVGLPNAYSEEGKVVPVIGHAATSRIDLYAIWFAKPRQSRIQYFAWVERIIVRGMNKE